MSLATRLKLGRNPLAETSLSGASGTTFTCNTIETKDNVPGSLTARFEISTAIGSVTFAPKWQVSQDNSTWVNLKNHTHAAYVTLTASTTLWMDGPGSLQAYPYARAAIERGGTTVADGAAAACKYNFQKTDEWAKSDIRKSVRASVTAASNATSSLAGSSLHTEKVLEGTLCANISACVETSGLVLTPQWQVSDDGSTWENFKSANNTSQVAFATGTGTSVTTTVALAAPPSICSHPYVRVAVLISGTSTTSHDDLTSSYNYVQRTFN